uniref:Mannosyltransferase n=1 Tax=Chromera velia CCMP2878 TaxID=1169474 RepID=A0A0G4H088_9ALVE|eukprot:Cvel_5507.t1-p1 / transcript=Cvel_5507.t1 / gene=Cvel_5507 / organism=Chromera_velia_CCMP2878 / gene_product=hypothetical protein / transcript_product=hypothetical protein / location=Cvel_scaffold257:106271-108481(+) / protein_length=240 / sequence_SO=supercontig / SO=protein_coding / is_pseudo=false
MEGEKEASSQADGQPDAQSHVQSERDGRTDGDATATATGGLTDGGPESGGDSAAAAPVSSAAGGPSQSKEKDKEREGGGREREKEKGAARQRDRERERERGDRGRAGGQLAWMGGGRERTSGALRGVPSYPSAGMEFIGSQAPIPLIPLGPSGPSMLWVSVDQMHFILSLMLAAARLLAALYSPITDCDETMNYWEPLHFLLQGSGRWVGGWVDRVGPPGGGLDESACTHGYDDRAERCF